MMNYCIQCGRRMAFLGICPSCKAFLTEHLAGIHREAQEAMEMFRRNDLLASLSRDQLAAIGSIPRELRDAMELALGSKVDEAISGMLAQEKLVPKLLEGCIQPPRSDTLELVRSIETWQGLRASEVDQLKRQLHESLDAVSRQAQLAAFRPRYEELANMVAYAKPAWDELLTSSTATYAFAAMAALREAIERAPFAKETIAALHSQLGDWRGIGLSAELFDQQKRQEAYLRAGLDRRLVDLEPQTFDAMLSATELRPATPPPLLRAYVSADLNEVVEVEADEELEQAVEDYRLLYRFESQLRGFVADVLSEAAGQNWTKQRVPGDCLKNWRDRRAQDREAKKHVHSLLSYADLGDWSKIIRRGDNWSLFEPYFNRQTFVEESFNRLIPLRNDVAHMRPLTEADRLVFYAEIQQLLVAIREPRVDEDEDFEEAALSH